MEVGRRGGDQGGRDTAPLRRLLFNFPLKRTVGISMDLPGGRRAGIQSSSKVSSRVMVKGIKEMVEFFVPANDS